MKIFPVPDKEIYVTWRRTLTNGLFASRHGVMVIAANLAAYAAMVTLYRSLEPRAHSQWVLVTGTFLAIVTLSFVSVYMLQLYKVSKSVVTDSTTNEQQLGAVLTSSYIGFRIYVALLLVACGLESGIASILRR